MKNEPQFLHSIIISWNKSLKVSSTFSQSSIGYLVRLRGVSGSKEEVSIRFKSVMKFSDFSSSKIMSLYSDGDFILFFKNIFKTHLRMSHIRGRNVSQNSWQHRPTWNIRCFMINNCNQICNLNFRYYHFNELRKSFWI